MFSKQVNLTSYFILCNEAEGICSRSTKWLGSSVGRVLARLARGHGFDSRSVHDFFLPCDACMLYEITK